MGGVDVMLEAPPSLNYGQILQYENRRTYLLHGRVWFARFYMILHRCKYIPSKKGGCMVERRGL